MISAKVSKTPLEEKRGTKKIIETEETIRKTTITKLGSLSSSVPDDCSVFSRSHGGKTSDVTSDGSLSQSRLDLNTSGSVSIHKSIISKFYNFQLSRVAYQTVFKDTETFVPESVAFGRNEIILLSLSSRDKSRLSFFDSQTLEINEMSEFLFKIKDFCVGNELLFFCNDQKLFSWKLANKSSGYDEVNVAEIDVGINAMAAKGNNLAIVHSKKYHLFPSLLVYKHVENRQKQTLETLVQHASDFKFRVDPFSVAFVDSKSVIVMKDIGKQLVVFSLATSSRMDEMMKFSLNDASLQGVRLSAGPVAQSFLAVIDTDERSHLAYLDLSKKTSVSLLGPRDSSVDNGLDNISSPIGCCYNQSKLVVLHHENFEDKQRLSLFDFKIKSRRSSWKRTCLYLALIILICVVAVLVAYFHPELLKRL